MSSPITQMQAIELLRNTMNELENWRILFAFKRMKLKHMREQTVNLMKACLSAHQYGLPITTDLMGAILDAQGRKQTAISSKLHTLGDKHCLVLKRGITRGRGAPYEWLVDPVFLEAYR